MSYTEKTVQAMEEFDARKSLRRSRNRWRFFTLVIILLPLVGFGLSRLTDIRGSFATPEHVASFSVRDIIFEDRLRDDLLEEIAQNENVKALIVEIDSPGGTLGGSEALFHALRNVAEQKPVVAVMHSYATSGGYMAAIAADYIFARDMTTTGSVGVIAEIPNASTLFSRIGIDFTRVSSGPLKGGISTTTPIDPVILAEEQALIDEAGAWFLDLAQARRGFDDETRQKVASGGVFLGRSALALGLIDAIGQLPAAQDYLAVAHNIDETLLTEEYFVEEPDDGVFDLLDLASATKPEGILRRVYDLQNGLWALHTR